MANVATAMTRQKLETLLELRVAMAKLDLRRLQNEAQIARDIELAKPAASSFLNQQDNNALSQGYELLEKRAFRLEDAIERNDLIPTQSIADLNYRLEKLRSRNHAASFKKQYAKAWKNSKQTALFATNLNSLSFSKNQRDILLIFSSFIAGFVLSTFSILVLAFWRKSSALSRQ